MKWCERRSRIRQEEERHHDGRGKKETKGKNARGYEKCEGVRLGLSAPLRDEKEMGWNEKEEKSPKWEDMGVEGAAEEGKEE